MSIRKAQCEAAWTLAARDGQAHLSLLPNVTITHDCMLRARSGRVRQSVSDKQGGHVSVQGRGSSAYAP